MLHTSYLIFLHLITARPQMNLYYTNENVHALQHDCLRVPASIYAWSDGRQIITYCLSQHPSTFHVEKTYDYFSNLTFAELLKENITSQQLYLWSASIDLIEDYQYYLNRLRTSNDVSLAKKVFYNCTLPRFGPTCQYQFVYYHSNASLEQIIRNFYDTYQYQPTTLTCYKHLQCNRASSPRCLDWSDICDGKIDCPDSELDEKHCWQLEINECQDDEYRCSNGQCISKLFLGDDANSPDCLDRSDERYRVNFDLQQCDRNSPSSRCEDVTCIGTSPFTSSCVKHRDIALLESMYLVVDESVSKECWSLVQCLYHTPYPKNSACFNLCLNDTCSEMINRTCPDVLFYPSYPVLYNEIYFGYTKENIRLMYENFVHSLYLCYHSSRYDDFFGPVSKTLFKNITCVQEAMSFSFPSTRVLVDHLINGYYLLNRLVRWHHEYHVIFNFTSEICSRSNMYQCIGSSKCISIHRLIDRRVDCRYADDENITIVKSLSAAEKVLENRFECQTSGQYLLYSLVKNGFCDCTDDHPRVCEDENRDPNSNKSTVYFQSICNGFTDLIPQMIDGRNETDETECEQWPCNNMYTHCDGFWNCFNGADEVGCNEYWPLNCSSDENLCVSPYNNQLMCLPIKQANDGQVDCLGATDERMLCRENYALYNDDKFYCMKENSSTCISTLKLCDAEEDCDGKDDERVCKKNRIFPTFNNLCSVSSASLDSDVEKVICSLLQPWPLWKKKYFTLDRERQMLRLYPIENVEKKVFFPSSIRQSPDVYQPRCHRGLDLRVGLNNACLCPPSYYGDQCQYQNQRVSLTIRFRTSASSSRTLLAIVISLIDNSDQRLVHSNEQFTYLAIRDCRIKFNVYLLYATRPKDPDKNYSIHLDIYEKVSLTYRGSLLFPITFPCLPVNRLALVANIPRLVDNMQVCTRDQCDHGKCIRYSNNPQNAWFCQCYQGWSGPYCTIPHTCQCSLDSLCIGVSAENRSICVCPGNNYGSRCLLVNTGCQTNDHSITCEHGGQCVPNDEYTVSNQTFSCICPNGFIGERCEMQEKKLTLSFAQSIVPSSSIFIHFIEIIEDGAPVRTTTFKTIPDRQEPIDIYWLRAFHLVFIELLNKNYYLAIVQKIPDHSTAIVKMINPADRCLPLSEVLNQTIVEWNLIRRIKYYHLPCQTHSSDLQCFYDEIHLCICDDFEQKRLANCFEFNHSMTFNCLGQSECEHDARCFQDKPDCPTRSMCVCPPCYYGGRCQFSTSGFGLSLDAILGYHLLPHHSLATQPFIVHFSLIMTILFIVAGLINAIFSIITFKNKSVRDFGCGFYLFGSSITTLLITILFALKFVILTLTQITTISNRSFLSVHCHSMDFLLRVCLNMDQWLNACVAIERAVTAVKNVHFDKKKSTQAAKWVIIILLILMIGSCAHDPIYRRLIDEINDDANMNRIWCIVRYPKSVEMFDSVIHPFHVLTPFLINLVSAIILITKQSRQKSNLHPHRPYKEHLREQCRQHRHLLIAPILLVVLAIPRVIIGFASKCMESASESWLYLMGYFISSIPPMLTFAIFILPSEFYKKEFRKALAYYRINLRRRLCLIFER